MTQTVQHDEVVEGSATEIVQYEAPPPPTLFRTEDPVEVIERATAAANALKSVIESRQLFKRISGKDHVLVEGWTTLGSMLGVVPVVVWSRPVGPEVEYTVHVTDYEWVNQDGRRVRREKAQRTYQVKGCDWEARVEARTLDGRVIGAAEALCSRKEDPWARRDDYALRSMAQTRATSKALRGPLGFVVTLAGYVATPAEEMQGGDEHLATGRAARPAVTADAPRSTEPLASARQRGLIMGKAAAAGLDGPRLANVLLAAAGQAERPFTDPDAATAFVQRQLDRWPARLVDAVLEQIRARNGAPA